MRVSKIWSLVLGLMLLALVAAWTRASMVSGAKEGFYPFARAVSWTQTRLVPRVAGLFRGASACARAAELEDEVALLRIQLAEMESVSAENAELRRQLGFAASSPLPLVACPVLPRGEGGWWREIRLGRGSSSGIAVGQVVLDAEGVVGRVSAVSPSTADVMLLTDPNFRLACEISVSTNRAASTVQGILYGSGVRHDSGVPELILPVEPLALRYLERDAPLDALPPQVPVRTSGRGGQVPRGLLVGYLLDSEIEADGLSRTGEVRPAADVSDLRMVFVMADGGGAK